MKDILVNYKIKKPIEIIPTGLHQRSFTQKDRYIFRNLNKYIKCADTGKIKDFPWCYIYNGRIKKTH